MTNRLLSLNINQEPQPEIIPLQRESKLYQSAGYQIYLQQTPNLIDLVTQPEDNHHHNFYAFYILQQRQSLFSSGSSLQD